MRKIVMFPDPILRVKTEPITQVDTGLKKDIADLMEVLSAETSHAAGLAAVQIGLNRRFFGLLKGKNKELKVFVNPRIDKTYGEKVRPVMRFEDGSSENLLEGCLSFPEFFGMVKRYLEVDVSWEEIENNILVKKTSKYKGFDAISFQHELDHLNGVLFVDHIKEEGGEFYKWADKKKIKWGVDKILEPENM